eukprot:SAG25_NODE_1196_length_3645_cov_2.730476_3_plen_115_part_00
MNYRNVGESQPVRIKTDPVRAGIARVGNDEGIPTSLPVIPHDGRAARWQLPTGATRHKCAGPVCTHQRRAARRRQQRRAGEARHGRKPVRWHRQQQASRTRGGRDGRWSVGLVN